jgi:hypothetical protein
VLEKAAETRCFRLQKFAELPWSHVVNFYALLGEGITDFRQGQNFGDLLIQAR